MIAIACDHTALDMKRNIEELLTDMGLEYMDFGTDSTASCDYPVFAVRAANKLKGIRCAACSEPYSATMTRAHNDANMLAIGARVIGVEIARMIVRAFLETPFEGGRHQRRVDMLTAIENGDFSEA